MNAAVTVTSVERTRGWLDADVDETFALASGIDTVGALAAYNMAQIRRVSLPHEDAAPAVSDVIVSAPAPAIQLEAKAATASGIARTVWKEVDDEVVNLLRLREGWDHRGADAISSRAVGVGRALIQTFEHYTTMRPSVVPTPFGGLQFEWHTAQGATEVEVRTDGGATVYVRHRPSGYVDEGELDALTGQPFAKWLALISDQDE